MNNKKKFIKIQKKDLINDIYSIAKFINSIKNKNKYLYIEDKFGRLFFKKVKYVKKKYLKIKLFFLHIENGQKKQLMS